MEQQDESQSIIRIGLIGHRDIVDEQQIAALQSEARQYFTSWQAQYDRIEVLSPLAIGADTILTQVALEFGSVLIAVVPFELYEQDFAGEARQSYRMMLYKAHEVQAMPFHDRSTGAYLVAGVWIADHVDILLAVWDGKPARGTGGTGDIIEYAQERHKKLIVFAAPRES